jgi:hypothetical protein
MLDVGGDVGGLVAISTSTTRETLAKYLPNMELFQHEGAYTLASSQVGTQPEHLTQPGKEAWLVPRRCQTPLSMAMAAAEHAGTSQIRGKHRIRRRRHAQVRHIYRWFCLSLRWPAHLPAHRCRPRTCRSREASS